ncbi:MAG: DUF4962 domain-containing protein [Deltaproteobacteria bacterium]|nr:DUF4962 domain-containing protein [Deltaproteobacteria bacterium]
MRRIVVVWACFILSCQQGVISGQVDGEIDAGLDAGRDAGGDGPDAGDGGGDGAGDGGGDDGGRDGGGDDGGSDPTGVHPRMFFFAGDIPEMRRQASGDKSEVVAPIFTRAEALLSEAVPDGPTQTGLNAFYDASEMSLIMAFAYVVTGEERYYNRARAYLLAFSDPQRWPYWGGDRSFGDRDLSLSAMITRNAIAYDWLHSRLSQADRATIRSALATHTQEMYEAATSAPNDEWLNWWPKSYAQNHWSFANGALGVGALVLEGEDDRTESWLAHAIGQFEINAHCYRGIGDGSWHEGIMYQNMKIVGELPFLYNLERLEGIDLLPEAYFRNFISARLFNLRRGTEYSQAVFTNSSYVPAWGGADVGGGHVVLRLLANRYRDGTAEWLTRAILEDWGRGSWRAAEYVLEFFFFDPGVQAREPTGIPMHIRMDDKQGVIWRTGWGGEDIIFALKTGPYGGRFFYDAFHAGAYPFDGEGADLNVGHNQQDANSFYLYVGAADLSSEMCDRHGDYNVMPTVGHVAHNTLLVDDLGQYWPPRHSSFPGLDSDLEATYHTPGFDFLVADATERYRIIEPGYPHAPGDYLLDEFRRHVLFVRPDYLVMIDRVRSQSPHKYEWIAHFSEEKPEPIAVESDWVKARADQENVLGVRILQPAAYAYVLGETAHTNSSETKPYIRIRPDTDVEDTVFNMLLYPTKLADWDDRPLASLLASADDRSSGARVALPDGSIRDHLVRYDRQTTSISLDDYTLDGAVASITKNGAEITRLFLGGGVELADSNGSRPLIQSPTEDTTLEVVFTPPSMEIFGQTLSGVVIFAPSIDSDQVSLNGQATAVSSPQADYIQLP